MLTLQVPSSLQVLYSPTAVPSESLQADTLTLACQTTSQPPPGQQMKGRGELLWLPKKHIALYQSPAKLRSSTLDLTCARSTFLPTLCLKTSSWQAMLGRESSVARRCSYDIRNGHSIQATSQHVFILHMKLLNYLGNHHTSVFSACPCNYFYRFLIELI